ncbi:hypothetical protein [Streptomyces sp. NBC_00151]|jgi:hypothetical protein|uniref:hypothetical protein n=1 Tax=Streptomyces sp. NBC_00151 TaxID=2975669 RepID=UPI002DDAD65B|nr:hypothetical protein [Streptomyces sp. NBC_00151]WRZ39412.1 hypothetical protein OG915_16020 [Streptomyces sp. NBC_00151]
MVKVLRKRFFSVCAVVGATIATIVLSTSPAAAGTTISVYTTDGGIKGGTGIFWHNGNGAQPPGKSVIGARDNQADGYRVSVRVIWRSGGALTWSTLENANGADPNGIITKVVSIPDGTPVTLEVCLKDGADGARKWCGSGEAVA